MYEGIHGRAVFKDKGDEAIGVARKFLEMASAAGVHLERAVLSGSYAKGTAGKWSDIDIALVSKALQESVSTTEKRLTPS